MNVLKKLNYWKSDIIAFINEHRYSFSFYFLNLVAFLILILVVNINLGEEYQFGKSAIYAFTGDFLLLFSPYWILPNRYKWTVISPIIFLSVFFVINIWYYRFWGNFLPTTSLHATGNINETLLNSVAGLVMWYDLIFLLPSTIIIIYLVLFNSELKNEKPLRIKQKWVLFINSIVAFLLLQFITVEKARRWYLNDLELELSYKQIIIDNFEKPVFNSIHYLDSKGIVLYLSRFLTDFVNISDNDRVLSDDELRIINDYLSSHDNFSKIGNFENNKSKNVIFIIVESLNAYVIEKRINGREITPFLNSLIHENGTIYSLNVETQVADGGSGDGQFIYNTGLLPLKGSMTPIMIVPNVNLHVLTDHFTGLLNLGAVFADDGKSWNQTKNFKTYGFTEVYSFENDAPDVILRGCDGAMFDKAINLIDKVSQPFFIEMVSISMHVPFMDPGAPSFDWLQQAGMSKNERNYLRMTAYFDEELQKFVTKLKERDLYDNTILILASDHSQNLAEAGAEHLDDIEIPIVFLATNTGMSKHIAIKNAQVDVFPTILEITGQSPATDYRGIGYSMLDSINNSLDRINEIQNISDLILQGNYFSRIQ